MNIKRTFFTLLMGSAGFGLFLANCTVSTSSSDKCAKGDKDTGCECAGKITGYQVCNSSGVFGDCQCPGTNTAGSSNSSAGNTSNDAGAGNTSEGGTTATAGNGGKGGTTANGGTTATAGTDAGGVSAAEGGAGGEGGAIGFVVDDPNDCEACLNVLCADDLTTCLNDATCADQYTSIIGCIDTERETGLAKRDVVRGCGVNVGSSPDASLQTLWGDPATLAPETTNLLNCMATSSSETPSSAWANDLATNFPNDMPAPWPADSCAKLSCTAKLVVK